MHCVIHILIHKHSFFLLQFMINMTEQITNQQSPLERMVDELSQEGKNALIKIGLNWHNIVGSYGSYVNRSILIESLKQERPWTANKLLGGSGVGRNGVVYEFIPMLEKYQLAVTDTGGRYVKHMLTPVGYEVIRLMCMSCLRCNNTRMCQSCIETPGFANSRGEYIQCTHVFASECLEPHDETNSSHYDGESCWSCQPNDEPCTKCTDRRLHCYSCSGRLECNSCDDVNQIPERTLQ